MQPLAMMIVAILLDYFSFSDYPTIGTPLEKNTLHRHLLSICMALYKPLHGNIQFCGGNSILQMFKSSLPDL